MSARVMTDTHVRLASLEDVPALVSLLVEFGHEREFRDPVTMIPDKLAELFTECISRLGVVFVLESDRPVGFIGVMLATNLLSKEIFASELSWFVLPDYRGTGSTLLREAEAWARTRGATYLTLIAPSDRIGRVYQRWGYVAGEAIYTKRLAPLFHVESRDTVSVLMRPMDESDAELVWTWAQDCWDLVADDRIDRSLEAFAAYLRDRSSAGIKYQIAESPDGNPCGLIGIIQTGPATALFQGILFAPSARGTGLASAAVRAVLRQQFANGIHKVSASFYAQNARVERLFRNLGAITEGRLIEHAQVHGQWVDMTLVSMFAGGTCT